VLQFEVFDGARWLPLLLAPGQPRALDEQPLGWGSFLMAPWPGRVAGARFEWEGREYRLPANHGAHSIHGRGVYQPWTPVQADAASCMLTLAPLDGWPFPARLSQSITVRDDGLVQHARIEAMDGSGFPAGMGWHPWFRRNVADSGDVRLLVDAPAHYETGDDLIPTGAVVPVSGDADLRGWPPAGARRLDTCFRDIRAMALRWGALTLGIECAEATHAVVYTPPHAVCVEPQTCVPDAFNLAARGVGGTGVVEVTPDRPLTATMVWRWSLPAPR
jgi:aldose 1-epimerase